MARFSIHSLRAKLQIFSLVLVVGPGVLVAAIALARARSALEQTVGRQLAELAHDALEKVTAALGDERAHVRTWARQEVMRDLLIGDLDKRISRFLRSLKDGGAPYLELVCIDREGRVVAASDPIRLGSMLGERAWARAALAGKEFVTGPIALPDRRGATIEIAAPIHDPEGSGTVAGALLGQYDWGHTMGLAAHVRETLLPHGFTVDMLILDRGGAIIGESWRANLGETAARHRRAAAARLARELPPTTRLGHVMMPEAGVLLGYERAEETGLGWLALVMEPLADALAPVRDMQRRLGLVLGAVLLGALGVATLLAGRMSRPLRELMRATEDIARAGEPQRPVEVRSRDEIGQLAAAFNAMAAELRRAQEDLLTAAKFAFVGEIAAGVAHEVRTPLGILKSSAQILGRSLPAGRAESEELVGMIIEEVDRLDHVVAGLLELARPHELLLEATSLASVLTRALDFVDGQAREKGITIHCAFAADSCRARCDPEQIYQVALNLIVNALQILPRGGQIIVRTLPRDDGHVAFEVIDNGPGIPAELRERIFAPFFTLRSGGTGLGLALAKRVVQAHQGTVSVESEVSRGTTFRVELPVDGKEP